MKAKEIQDLIDFIAKSGLDEVNIETEEFKIKVKRNTEAKKNSENVKSSPAKLTQLEEQTSSTVSSLPSTEVQINQANNKASVPDESKYKVITSPMIGTFYRCANPGSPYFVNVGDKITAGQTVCIVEAMKLFNEIEAEISGTLVKILVENASPVEYDQPLFLVDPA
ncbi:MAG: acetyl-CoA carboxylase biotin carboxyl carrier protein [Bacteroidota bacterium]|nr:acetyl-CoA carboxylase biotin carboxyl carrier protein [Bacteroidota bacterium]